MNKQNGFTLLELCIVMAIIGIIAAIILPEWQRRNNPNYVPPKQATYVWTPSGTRIEIACIENFKVMVSYDGDVAQVTDTNGNGVACQ